jgi:hypothetical protein
MPYNGRLRMFDTNYEYTHLFFMGSILCYFSDGGRHILSGRALFFCGAAIGEDICHR